MALAFKELKKSIYRKANSREYVFALKLQDYHLFAIRSIAKKVLNKEILSEDQLSLLRHANNWRNSDKLRNRKHNNWYNDYTESDYEIGAYELAVDWAK